MWQENEMNGESDIEMNMNIQIYSLEKINKKMLFGVGSFWGGGLAPVLRLSLAHSKKNH